MKFIGLLLLIFTSPTFADYDRDDWKHWIDTDRDCQNTRQELLIKESMVPVTFSNRQDGKACTVVTGKWYGPFLGRLFTKASDLDLDHVIPLKWAYENGGAEWAPDIKGKFANDPQNLLLVDDSENSSKGARGPADWMPKNKDYACDYIKKWASLIAANNLTPNLSDKNYITSGLATCGEQSSVGLQAPEIIKIKSKSANGDMSIKLSKTGKCHKPGGSYYERTKAFTPFSTMEECLTAGGVEALR